MKAHWIRLAADYGGIVNAGLCLVHCAAGPVLLAFWQLQPHGAEAWESAFLFMSGLLVLLATWRMSSGALRNALWGSFLLFAGAGLLAERYPWLEIVQYGASLSLMGMHLLNLRHVRHACG